MLPCGLGLMEVVVNVSVRPLRPVKKSQVSSLFSPDKLSFHAFNHDSMVKHFKINCKKLKCQFKNAQIAIFKT